MTGPVDVDLIALDVALDKLGQCGIRVRASSWSCASSQVSPWRRRQSHLTSRRSPSSVTGLWRARLAVPENYNQQGSMSISATWERVRTLFHAALDQPPELRDAFLSRTPATAMTICGDECGR